MKSKIRKMKQKLKVFFKSYFDRLGVVTEVCVDFVNSFCSL